MSGPKRADVTAALNVAQREARRAEAVVAGAESNAVAVVIEAARRDLRRAESQSSELSGAAEGLGRTRRDVAAVSAALDAVTSARDGTEQAANALEEAERLLAQAQKAEAKAVAEADAGQREYDKAAEGLRRAGQHYLREQMNQAQEARRHFEAAAVEGANASKLRKSARDAARKAATLTGRAAGQARAAAQAASSAMDEARALDRAEAEARRIAEEARRRAVVALESARGAVGGLPSADCAKFAPGRAEALRSDLSAADWALTAGDSGACERTAARVTTAASDLARSVAAARADFDRRQAEAAAAVSALQAAVDSADAKLIRSWSDRPSALDEAGRALADARAALAAEDFGAVGRTCSAQVDGLGTATATAAAAMAADERRAAIGDAVMDVLEDMGFDVSYEPGSRDQPLRIAGQTATENGTGDFDIEIPLSGEVDFEVTATAGDASCHSAVTALQEKLKEHGIAWDVTDWGYATGHEPAAGIVVRETKTLTQKRTVTRGH